LRAGGRGCIAKAAAEPPHSKVGKARATPQVGAAHLVDGWRVAGIKKEKA